VPTSAGGKAEISFTVPHDDLRVATGALQPMEKGVFASMSTQREVGKVSIVGAGMRSHPGVAAKVFRVLNDESINIEMISTSPIKISCVIARGRVEQAVKALHSAFELSGPGTVGVEEPFRARAPS
jgi:aspartate kinase